MKEVACKVLNGFFQNLERNRIPIARFTVGSRYPLQHLQNKHERIEWSEFVLLMRNARQIWSEHELVELGNEFLRSPFLRAYQLIARLLFSTRELIHFTNTEFGNQVFACVRATERDLAPDVVEIELVLAEGYEIDETYFQVARGAFKYMPCIMGFPPAAVDMKRDGRSTRYQMKFTVGGGALSGLRKLVMWPSTVLNAGRELRESNRQLQSRYEELEKTRDALSNRSTQLETANRITTLIHGNLDLGRTMERVADALVVSGRFEAAEVKLTIGAPYDLKQRAGITVRGQPEMIVPVDSRGTVIGEIGLWVTPGHDPRERKELLDKVIPSIATTLDEALTYTMLQESREHLEQRVGERTAELSNATDRLAHTLDEVTQAKRARDRIFANINHEIRTPLSIIKSATAELRRGESDLSRTAVDSRVESIDFATNRLLRVVNDLLDLAAGTEGKLSLQRSRFDLAKHLRVVAAAWARVAEQEGITLSFVGPDAKPVYLDQDKIDRSVSNVLSNAIKYTPRGGTIVIRLVCGGQQLSISVRDSGPGLDDDFMNRVFGRFEQGRPPIRGMSGSGIGLSLVKEVAELHGGKVFASNSSGGGALFEIVLPDKEDSGRAIFGNAPAQYRTLAPAAFNLTVPEVVNEILQPPGAAEATLLVVEDDPTLRDSLGRLLSVKYRVLLAGDGEAALMLARKYLPDLLVSDVDMPLLDGIELLHRFQKIPGMQMPSAILLSALSGLSDRLVGLEAGAVDYVAKPFEPKEVLARVESQLALRRRALEAARNENLSSLGTMVKGLMHEIRNPANGVVHAVKLLRELLPADSVGKGSPADELLDVAEMCASQLESLCIDLVGTNGRGDPIRRAVPLNRVVERARSLVSGFLANIQLTYEPGYEGEVFCSEPLIAQVLANLIKNSAYAAKAGGWIRVVSRVEGTQLVLEVMDSGPGVPPELRQRIFDTFFTTKGAGEGTGLGLPMSRQIIERHGGVLEVRDSADGSLFQIRIPVAAAAKSAGATLTA